jgi:hypothetical protein
MEDNIAFLLNLCYNYIRVEEASSPAFLLEIQAKRRGMSETLILRTLDLVNPESSSTLQVQPDMFRAIGFGIVLITIRIMMPEVFEGLEDTLVKFFSVLNDTMGQLPHLIDQTAMVYPHAVALPH